MRLGTRLGLGLVSVAVGIAAAQAARAITVDLALVLGNSGYENGNATQWTSTQPNTQYVVPVPIDPSINPLDPCCTNGTTLGILLAPAGSHFAGVATTDPAGDTVDEKGKLVHTALQQSFAADTIFQVTVWANRGRIGTNQTANTNSTFGTASPPILSVNLSGWNSGTTTPTVNSSDNWSRNPAYNNTQSFTAFGNPGQWTSQTFTWSPGVALTYISLAITGQNRNHHQYIAWDVAAVPEPSTGLLLALGLCGIAARRRSLRT